MKYRSVLFHVALAALVLLAGCAGGFGSDDGSPSSTTNGGRTVVPRTTTHVTTGTATQLPTATTTSSTDGVGIPDAKLRAFARFGTHCGRDPRTLEVEQSTTTDAIAVTVRGRIRVNDTAVTIERPELVKTGPLTYRLNVETRTEETDGNTGRTCPAETGYEASVRLPNAVGVTFVIAHGGEVEGILKNAPGGSRTPRPVTTTATATASV